MARSLLLVVWTTIAIRNDDSTSKYTLRIRYHTFDFLYQSTQPRNMYLEETMLERNLYVVSGRSLLTLSLLDLRESVFERLYCAIDVAS